MKKIVAISLLTFAFTTQSMAKECQIRTSPLDSKTMTFAYSNWNARTIPIITTTDFEYTSFVNAYKEFDESLRRYLRETVCKKNKHSGVANYKVEWQQTDKAYNFTASFDVFSQK